MDKKTILIVDDEKDLVELLSEKLEQAGFKVLTAHDGQEGLNVALREKPDLILLDIIMPTMDGLTMLKKLREDEWGKNAEAVLLTVLDDPKTLSEAMEMGSYEYFVKTDWNIDDVVGRIKEKIAAKKRERAVDNTK